MPLRQLSLLVLWIAAGRVVAHAHATLLHTEPIANTQLPDAPGKVRLSFNERVEPIFNSIRVVDVQGRRVDSGESRVVGEGDNLEVGLNSVADGAYAVLWRINSVDGHQVQGHFGFGVRAAPPDEKTMAALPASEQRPFWRYYTPVVKWAGLTSLVIWLGGVSFSLGVFTPTYRAAFGAERAGNDSVQAAVRRSFGFLWNAAILFLIAECLALIGHAVTFTDLPLARAISLSTLATVLPATSYGQWWTIRILAALGLLGLCAWQFSPAASARRESFLVARSRPLFAVGSAVLGGVILLTIPLTGHARATPPAFWAVGGDWLHLVSTAVWIGGLVHCWAVVSLLDGGSENMALLSMLTGRFSRIARVSVGVILATGIYNAWLHMPSWSAFLSTSYGKVLLTKAVLIVPILLIAAVNWRRVLPSLEGFSRDPNAARKWAGNFRRLIGAETMLGAVVLVLATSLTSLPPSATVSAAGPMTLSKRNGDITVGLKLEPNKVGTNQSVITLRDSGGRAVEGAKRVTLYLRSLDMDMGLQTVQAQAAGGGAYQAEVFLSMAGRWSISVEVTPSHGDTFVTEFQTSTRL